MSIGGKMTDYYVYFKIQPTNLSEESELTKMWADCYRACPNVYLSSIFFKEDEKFGTTSWVLMQDHNMFSQIAYQFCMIGNSLIQLLLETIFRNNFGGVVQGGTKSIQVNISLDDFKNNFGLSVIKPPVQYSLMY